MSDILLVGCGKFLSNRTKQIMIAGWEDSGTTVSPVERGKRIDKRRRAILPRRRDIFVDLMDRPGQPLCHTNIPGNTRDDRLSFRSEQLHQPRPQRIDGPRKTIRRFPWDARSFFGSVLSVWRLHSLKIHFWIICLEEFVLIRHVYLIKFEDVWGRKIEKKKIERKLICLEMFGISFDLKLTQVFKILF